MDPFASGRQPFRISYFFVLLATQIVVTIPSFLPKILKFFVLLLLGYIPYQIITSQTTGRFELDLGIGSGILIQYIIGIDLALISSPDDLIDYHDKQISKVSQRPFLERLRWTFRQCCNPRGIGCAHEPKYLPPSPSPSTSRSAFVFSRILFTLMCFTIVAAMYIINGLNPGLTTPNMLLSDAPLHWRLLGVVCFGSGAACTLCAHHSILSIFVVGLGYSSPERWPPFIGSPFRIWSISTFWRSFWHQAIRKTLLTFSSTLLGFVFTASKTESIPYKLAQLYVVFFFSGVFHMAGDFMVIGKVTIYRAFRFFMLQPFGITLEYFVVYLWRRFTGAQRKPIVVDADEKKRGKGTRGERPPLWIHGLGLVWLTFWMAYTAPYLIDTLCAVNTFHDVRADLRLLIFKQ